MYYIVAACGCNIGKVRVKNEDNFYFGQRFLPKANTGLPGIIDYQSELIQPVCFGVFDGMGGETFGEEASFLAAQTMDKHLKMKFELPNSLLDICAEANREVCLAARKHSIGLMGSTAVLIGLKNEIAYLVNIGDSRAFLYRAGKIRQISVDHTDQFLFPAHGIHNRKPRLTQHLGIEPEEMLIEPYVTEIQLQDEDIFLLCSDGLTDMLDESDIKDILQDNSTVTAQTEMLIQKALHNGGRDNITAILCKIVQA